MIPHKCPCCDGYGKRGDAACVSCHATGIVWCTAPLTFPFVPAIPAAPQLPITPITPPFGPTAPSPLMPAWPYGTWCGAGDGLAAHNGPPAPITFSRNATQEN